MHQDTDKELGDEENRSAAPDSDNEPAPGEEEEVPLKPEAQELLNVLGRLIDSEDKEALPQFFDKLKVMNAEISPEQLDRERGDTAKERFLEGVLKISRQIVPKILWLKWMVRMDRRFLLTRAMLKMRNEGLQLNIAGKNILDPPGEKKGRIYLPPEKDGGVDANKLLLRVKEEYPARLQRFYRNEKRLDNLQSQREGAS